MESTSSLCPPTSLHTVHIDQNWGEMGKSSEWINPTDCIHWNPKQCVTSYHHHVLHLSHSDIIFYNYLQLGMACSGRALYSGMLAPSQQLEIVSHIWKKISQVVPKLFLHALTVQHHMVQHLEIENGSTMQHSAPHRMKTTSLPVESCQPIFCNCSLVTHD